MTATPRIEADYLVETPIDPRQASEVMAGEQSSGTFVAVPGETEDLKQRSAARVERLAELPPLTTPSLPGSIARPGQVVNRARVTLSWPLENTGASLPNLMATVAGNLFELQQLSGLRIEDIRLPNAFISAYPGPQFGVDGTRRLAGVSDGPLIGTIIKPSIGFNPEQTAQTVKALADGGIDFIKDDELQSDGSRCPFDARVDEVMNVINAHADRTGKKVMYAFNITGEIDQMLARHDRVESAGGTCVMVSLNSIGLTGLTALRRHCRLPIHAHRNGWGYLGRSPALGWSYIAWQKLWRVAGADHMHVNGLANKFSEDDDSVIASARGCLAPLSGDNPCICMPVFSSGQTVLQAAPTFARLQSADLIFAAGGGIIGHPSGIEAGVRSLRDAWDAAMAGIDINEYAATRPALASAIASYRK